MLLLWLFFGRIISYFSGSFRETEICWNPWRWKSLLLLCARWNTCHVGLRVSRRFTEKLQPRRFVQIFVEFGSYSFHLVPGDWCGVENRGRCFWPNRDGLEAVILNWVRLVPLKLVCWLPNWEELGWKSDLEWCHCSWRLVKSHWALARMNSP